MRHLLAMRIAHGFSQRAAGTDPSAVRPLAPLVNQERDDDERLHETDPQPPPQRMVGEDVVDVEGEREDEAVRAPVGTLMTDAAVVGFEERIGDAAQRPAGFEETVASHPRQDDLGKDEQRDALEKDKHHRLERDVRRRAPAAASYAEDD